MSPFPTTDAVNPGHRCRTRGTRSRSGGGIVVAVLPAVVLLAGAGTLRAQDLAPVHARIDAALDKAAAFLLDKQQTRMRLVTGKDANLFTGLDNDVRDVTTFRGTTTVKVKGDSYDNVAAILPAGWFAPEPDETGKPDPLELGARTSLVTLALIEAGLNPNHDRRLRKAVECLCGVQTRRSIAPGKEELQPGFAGTRAEGLRAMALGAALQRLRAGDLRTQVTRALAASGKQLAEGFTNNGFGVALVLANGQGDFNIVSTAWGIAGLAATGYAEAGGKVWTRLAQCVLDMQSAENGGFGAAGLQTATEEGTVAGLACLAQLWDVVGARPKGAAKPLPAAPGADPMYARLLTSAEKAHGWLTANGGKGASDAQVLFLATRAAGMGGLRRAGGGDRINLDTGPVLAAQETAGSWSFKPAGGFATRDERALAKRDPVVETAYRVAFLAAVRTPVLVAKVRWGPRDETAKWAHYPRDASGLAEWHLARYGTPARRIITDLRAGAEEELADAPLAILCSAAEPVFTPEEVGTLKKYLQRGGTLLISPAGPGAHGRPFVEGMQRLARAMFPAESHPELQFVPLGKDHPLTARLAEDPVTGPVAAKLPLMHLTNGARSLAFLCNEDVGHQWDAGYESAPNRKPARPEVWALAAAVRDYVTDRAARTPRPRVSEPGEGPPTAKGTARIGVVRYKCTGLLDLRGGGEGGGDAATVEAKADWDTPASWTAFRARCLEITGLEIEEVRGVPLTGGAKLSEFDVLHLAGHAAFALSKEEKLALAEYLAGGGGLLIEPPAGGGEAFLTDARKLLDELFPKRLRPLGEGHALLSGAGGGREVTDVTLSRRLSGRRPPPTVEDLLFSVSPKGRPTVLLCTVDVSYGLAGQSVLGRQGLGRATAEALAANLLIQAKAARGTAASP